MKLFVEVLMLVSVSVVFADDVVWRVAPPFSLMPGGRGQAPKDRVNDSEEKKTQAQNTQQNTSGMPTFLTQPDASSSDKAGQHTQDNVEPKEASTMGDWFFHALWTIGAIVAIVHAVLSGILNFLNYNRTKKRDVVDDRYRERTEKFAYTKERPKLTFVEWELTPHDRGKSWTIDDPLDTVRCVTVNTNGAPATLGGIYENC